MADEETCISENEIRFTVDLIPTTLTLTIINLVILAGNSLVIIAVITTRKLRTNTNTYIVSLACSDILLGIFVIPFSASLEILTYWPFGEVWCSIWLAIDVLLCTASILNLLAISFDRYLAVTKPIQYASAMSRRRSKVLVTFVWLLSFVICIPPLLGWNDKTSYSKESPTRNVTAYVHNNFSSMVNIEPIVCNNTAPQCELISTQGYRIYSALGSFYIPMFLMVFFYCKIYKAAVRTTSAIRTGVLTARQNDDVKNDDPIILRIHRGNSVVSRSSASSRYSQRTGSLRSALRNTGDRCARNRHCVYSECNPNGGIPSSKEIERMQSKRLYFEEPGPEAGKEPLEYIKLNNNTKSPEDSPFMKRRRSTPFIYAMNKRNIESRSLAAVPEGRHSNRIHIRKILKETKATKTVAIIVGVFTMCWFPFFTMYLIEAFWGTRVPSLAFSVMFWLGYCNSMLNPFIYGMFSRDFRCAFRRILRRSCYKCCKCKCFKRPKNVVVHKHHLGFPVIDFESTSES
ncbi:octopamine receptor 1-like [Mytilus californianus]|uniref:octopamine receptor 1-like n=1 Tax=Mytilus californianus TaxID=6549 RepID=UPI0022467594|nr:octopamine receptor 1-like [Mytilus californianus]